MDLRFRGAAVSTVSPSKTSSTWLQSRALVAVATQANTQMQMLMLKSKSELSLSLPSAVVLSSRFNETHVSVLLLTHTSVGARGWQRSRSKVPPGASDQQLSSCLSGCDRVLLSCYGQQHQNLLFPDHSHMGPRSHPPPPPCPVPTGTQTGPKNVITPDKFPPVATQRSAVVGRLMLLMVCFRYDGNHHVNIMESSPHTPAAGNQSDQSSSIHSFWQQTFLFTYLNTL